MKRILVLSLLVAGALSAQTKTVPFAGLGVPELAVALVGLVALGVIGLAVSSASPVGDLPYRWGQYVAVSSMLAAVFCLGAAVVAPQVDGRIGCLVFAFWTAFVGVGLYRRKRYGAVAHIVASFIYPAVVVIAGLAMITTYCVKGEVLAALGSLMGTLAGGAITALPGYWNLKYFRRRWQYLSQEEVERPAFQVVDQGEPGAPREMLQSWLDQDQRR